MPAFRLAMGLIWHLTKFSEDMTKGKRRKQIGQGKSGRDHQQRGQHPSPVPSAGFVQQTQPSEEAIDTTARQQKGTPQGPQESPVGAKGSNVDWQLRIAFAEAFFSLCLLALAGVGAWYAKGQLAIMRDQSEVMIAQNRIMLAQQRPWIGVTAAPLGTPKAGDPWRFKCEVENTGQSTATVTGAAFDVIYFKPGEAITDVGELIVAGSEPKDNRINIATGGSGYGIRLDIGYLERLKRDRGIPLSEPLPPGMTAGFTAWKTDIDASTAAAIEDGSIIPVAVALVRYTDAGDSLHHVRMLGVYDRNAGKLDCVPEHDD